jgi:hypothetical protein
MTGPIQSLHCRHHAADLPTDHVKHRQEQDLLGLTLQASNNSEVGISESASQAVLEEKIAACPVHSTLLSGLQGDANALLGQGAGPKLIPIERYVAEGLAERYTLLSLSHSNTGAEWARYSSCLCGSNRG